MSGEPRIEYELDFRFSDHGNYEDVIWAILEEAVTRAKARAIRESPVSGVAGRSGTLRGSHYAKIDKRNQVVYLGNTAPYAEFVLPRGWAGRWRWFLGRCLRDAASEVSIEKLGGVEEGFLATLGPALKRGGRVKESARSVAVIRSRAGSRSGSDGLAGYVPRRRR